MPPTDSRQFWSNGARGYLKYQDAMRPLSEEVVRLLETRAPSTPKFRVLDIACGAGEPSNTLAKSFPQAEITATDFAHGMLEVAKECAAQQNVQGIKYEVADAQDLAAYATDSFDVITCVAAVFMMPEPKKALEEFKRVLKPGGQAFITVWSTPDEMNFATVNFATLGRLLQDGAPPQKPPFNFTDPEELKSIVSSCGFSSVKISDFNLVFEYSLEALKDMGDHPMTTMSTTQLIKAGKVEPENAWPFFFKELTQTMKDEGYVSEDGIATFPINRAFIAHAIA